MTMDDPYERVKEYERRRDEQLLGPISEVTRLIREYGNRSNELREYVKRTAKELGDLGEEFVDLSATLIRLSAPDGAQLLEGLIEDDDDELPAWS